MGGDLADSLVTWTFPVLHQISLSNFLFDCLLITPQKKTQLHKCEELPLVSQKLSCKRFPVDRNTGKAAQGCAG